MYVVFDGTGSFAIAGLVFKPGATWVDDEAVIARIRRINKPYLTVRETRELPDVAEDVPMPIIPVVFDKFQGRDDQWYFHYPVGEGAAVEQSLPFETEAEVDAAIVAAKKKAEQPLVPMASEVAEANVTSEAGTLGKEEARATSYPCESPGCMMDPFSTSGARENHQRIAHPELYGKPARGPAGAPVVPPPPAPPAPVKPIEPASDTANPSPVESAI